MRKAGDFGKIRFFQGLCGFRIGDPGQWRLDMACAMSSSSVTKMPPAEIPHRLGGVS